MNERPSWPICGRQGCNRLPNVVWTEIGAKYVGIFQSLLVTCRLQGVDPYTYLVDVLQRVDRHPASDVAALTPRLWKEPADPLRSDIDRRTAIPSTGAAA